MVEDLRTAFSSVIDDAVPDEGEPGSVITINYKFKEDFVNPSLPDEYLPPGSNLSNSSFYKTPKNRRKSIGRQLEESLAVIPR